MLKFELEELGSHLDALDYELRDDVADWSNDTGNRVVNILATMQGQQVVLWKIKRILEKLDKRTAGMEKA